MYRVSLTLRILVGVTCVTTPQAKGKFRYRYDHRRVLNSSPSYYRNDCCYVHNGLDDYNDTYRSYNAVPHYNSLDYYNNIYKPYYAVPHF